MYILLDSVQVEAQLVLLFGLVLAFLEKELQKDAENL